MTAKGEGWKPATAKDEEALRRMLPTRAFLPDGNVLSNNRHVLDKKREAARAAQRSSPARAAGLLEKGLKPETVRSL